MAAALPLPLSFAGGPRPPPSPGVSGPPPQSQNQSQNQNQSQDPASMMDTLAALRRIWDQRDLGADLSEVCEREEGSKGKLRRESLPLFLALCDGG